MSEEVLVHVEGVSKKFCRSLKKSLWYGVCDIAGELLPFGKRQRVAGSELRVAGEEAEVAGKELRVTGENQSASGPVTSYPPLVTSPTGEASLRPGEFWAVKNVSFELRRGECLGLIGHNGAGGNPILSGREPKGWEARRTSNRRLARRVQRRREGASHNIYTNGSVLGFTKKEPEAGRRGGRVPQVFAGRENREPNRREDQRDYRLCRDSGIHRLARAEKTQLDIKMMANTD